MVPLAGWYPDPSGRYRSRLWSGHHWTGKVNEFRGEDDPLREDEAFDPPPEDSHFKLSSLSAPPQPLPRGREQERHYTRGTTPAFMAATGSGMVLLGLVLIGYLLLPAAENLDLALFIVMLLYVVFGVPLGGIVAGVGLFVLTAELLAHCPPPFGLSREQAVSGVVVGWLLLAFAATVVTAVLLSEAGINIWTEWKDWL